MNGRIDMLVLTDWQTWRWNQLPHELRRGKVDVMRVSSGIKWSGLVWWLFDLVKVIPIIKGYDVVICHGINAVSLILLMLERLRMLELPFFVLAEFNLKEHDGTLRSGFKYAVLRFMFKNIDLVFPVSATHGTYLCEMFGWNKEQVIPILQAGIYQGLSEHATPRYGLGNFVLALGRTQRDYYTFHSAIRGRTDRIIIVTNKKSVKGIKFDDNVELLFDIPLQQLLELISESKYVVIPLKNSANPAGLRMLIFAMEMGKATIVTKTTSISEYFPEDGPVVLVPPCDPLALKRAMETLDNDPGQIISYGEKAREFARTHLTSEAYISKVYEAICERYEVYSSAKGSTCAT